MFCSLSFEITIAAKAMEDTEKSDDFRNPFERARFIHHVCEKMFGTLIKTMQFNTTTKDGRDISKIIWELDVDHNSPSSRSYYLEFFFNHCFLEILKSNPELDFTFSIDKMERKQKGV